MNTFLHRHPYILIFIEFCWFLIASSIYLKKTSTEERERTSSSRRGSDDDLECLTSRETETVCDCDRETEGAGSARRA